MLILLFKIHSVAHSVVIFKILQQSLEIPAHLKGVTTLPCEILGSVSGVWSAVHGGVFDDLSICTLFHSCGWL